MRDDPKTISAAIKSARQEYTLQQRFHLRTGRNYFAPQSSSGSHCPRKQVAAIEAQDNGVERELN